ncbi:MAG: hypothetical protein Q7J07_04175 [Pelolinea sp.]|nr:hypothetical protein [Pelolinea sp.]
MGWEERKGRKYYYHKTRIGSHVQSFYMGKNIQTYIIHSIIQERRREEEAYRTMVKNEKKKDNEINAYHELVNQLANAVLVLNGYHTHKGEWRKKRD